MVLAPHGAAVVEVSVSVRAVGLLVGGFSVQHLQAILGDGQ
jgi:hypothetical protein